MKVSIIGGGLGGLACAISLAHKGYDVHLFEKNSTLGGKMRPVTLGDYYFDFGPNTITMPYVFNQVIEQTGVDAAPYFRFVEVQPHMKNVGVNGETFYLSNNRAFMIRQLQHLDPHGAKNYPAFITEISRLYFLARQHFLNKAFLSKKDFISPKLANALLAVRPFETLEKFLQRYFTNPFVLQCFLRYATYIGSSPYKTPATFAMIAYLELVEGVYYVPGGTASIAKGFERRARELGVKIYTNSEVININIDNGVAKSIELKQGEKISSDLLVVNADILQAMPTLMDSSFLAKKRQITPSSSVFVILAGLNKKIASLEHHNVFFSPNYFNEFEQLFEQKVYANEPTIYICNSSKTDVTRSPKGDNLLILVNAPAGQTPPDQYDEIIMKQLERYSIYIKDAIVQKQIITPQTIEQDFNSYKGALYGYASNSFRSAFFRHSNKSSIASNLYFVGGSTHPGGGSPLVTLGGMHVADAIVNQH
ncbi:phytoene desaturase family protein [Lysinibacillus tabacifolii]|uniref:4,4'-diaponeurosporene oxygenase n=1 Tax=Lysinibacillus tabacifolii TaxID=1173107 RepID=A0ABY2SXW3_9BACI|nr:phytoene desaturase family protein [Lysinibacillus tabacifolii]TKI48133.1 phytoene desaturase [Lysinibacillus tabacifolii]